MEHCVWEFKIAICLEIAASIRLMNSIIMAEFEYMTNINRTFDGWLLNSEPILQSFIPQIFFIQNNNAK